MVGTHQVPECEQFFPDDLSVLMMEVTHVWSPSAKTNVLTKQIASKSKWRLHRRKKVTVEETDETKVMAWGIYTA